MDPINAPKEVSPPETAAQSAARSGLRETFVYATIALVAVALGAGLKLHMELEAPLAAAFALPVALVLLLAHQNHSRGRVIAALRTELVELRRSDGHLHRVMREPQPGMQTRTSAKIPAANVSLSSGNTRGPEQAGPGLAASAQASPPRSPGIAQSAPAQLGTPRIVPVQSSVQVRSPQSAPAAAPVLGQSSVPSDNSKPALPPPLPGAARTPSALPPLPSGNAVESQAVGTSKIAAHVSDALLGTYWGHRPGTPGEATRADGAGRSTDGSAQKQPQIQSGASGRAALPPSELEDGPGERELETMQNLIQQLAAQLNAPRTPVGEPPSIVTEPASKMDVALTQSLSALRSTAATMRQEPEPQEREPKAGLEPKASAKDDITSSTATGAAAAGAEQPPPGPQISTTPAAGEPRAVSPYAELARVAEAVAAERIEVFLDPILALADKKARLFEVSVRLRSSDGDMLDPNSIRSIASGTGLLARIDAAKLARSARVAARLKSRGTDAALYSNLARESLSDDVFLDTFEDAMAEQDDLPQRLVLSFSQADVRAFNDVHWETTAAMSDIGLRFALDDVADLDMDFEKLKECGFEFVKLDARVFLDGLPAPDGTIPASDLCRHFAGQGFTLIVGRIEDEVAHAKLLGFGVLFGQGTFFGGARAVQVDPQPMPQEAAA